MSLQEPPFRSASHLSGSSRQSGAALSCRSDSTSASCTASSRPPSAGGIATFTNSGSADCPTAMPRFASRNSRATRAASRERRASPRLRPHGKPPFSYVYDFGDDWEHVIEFEQLLALDPNPRTVSCIDGARARPPEDVGGINGYAGFLDCPFAAETRSSTLPHHRLSRRRAELRGISS